MRALGYSVKIARDEDYLVQKIAHHLEASRVAALHLDEMQDSGRNKTGDSMELFAKRFGNLMQDSQWPICLILSATRDAKAFINHDPTLTRRLKPIEMRPASVEADGRLICATIEGFLAEVWLSNEGLLSNPEFMERLLHAGARCFGLVIDISLEAIGEAVHDGSEILTIDHFTEVYYARSNSDDDLNPFVTELWRTIDTRKTMDRWNEVKPVKSKSRQK